MELDLTLPVRSSFIDLTGHKYGRVTVLSYAGRAKGTYTFCWNCICDCGTKFVVRGASLKDGNTKGCGCLHKEWCAEKSKNAKGPPESYKVWGSIKQRCYNPKSSAYQLYGARGITMSDEWKDSFATFIGDMGPRPTKKHSIDRINNDGHYCKSNCRWALPTAQGRNTRHNHWLTFNGVTLCLEDWCERIGIDHSVIIGRIERGWPIDKVLTAPLGSKVKKTKPGNQRLYTYKGKVQNVSEWAKEFGIRMETLWYRLDRGMSIEDALLAPIRSR